MKKHHEKFMEDSKLRQLWHKCDANNVEAFNKFLTKFLSKDKTHCQTIENKARSMLAVGLQSVGHRQFYELVFSRTGVVLEEDDMTSLFLRKEDADKLWRKMHRRKESHKITRMRHHHKKLRDGVAKLRADNAKALGYEAGMMEPGGEDVRQQQPQQRRRRSSGACKHCGSTISHMRITSRQCPKNPKSKTAETSARGDWEFEAVTCRWESLPVWPDSARFSFCTEIGADPTEEGILPGDTLDDIGSQPTEELDEGSIFDGNLEILALERRAFDDVDGTESDEEWANCRAKCFRQGVADAGNNLKYLDNIDVRQDKTLATKNGQITVVLSCRLRDIMAPPTQLRMWHVKVATHSVMHEECMSTFLWDQSQSECQSISVQTCLAENGKMFDLGLRAVEFCVSGMKRGWTVGLLP
jgi:hypothetical protein